MSSNGFAQHATTRIYQAVAGTDNEYVADEVRLSGYDLLELMEKKSFSDVVFLQLSGELPNKTQKSLLDKLMIAFINLGPQHPAIRAAMTAGISKSNTEHILPIGLMVLGGAERGAKEVENSYHFIVDNKDKPVELVTEKLCKGYRPSNDNGDTSIAPGFGSIFGVPDKHSDKIGKALVESASNLSALTWSRQLSKEISAFNAGWLPTGIVAAAGIDLGLGARETLALFQIICSPGIAAQGIEQTHNPITSMPFVADEQYNYVGK